MSEEKFDYEEFAKSMYEQSLALMPEDIGVGDKEYLAIIIKQYILMSGEAIAHEHYEYDSDTRLFVAQVIAEWTFNEGIEIIRNGVKGESRDALLNTVAFIVWEIIKDAIEKDISNQEYLDTIENQVKKGLCRQAMNLFCENKISESVAKTFIKNEEEFNNLKKIVEKEIRQREELFLAEYGKEEWVKYYDQRYEELTKQITENPNDAEAYYARGSFQSGYGYVDNNIVLSDYNKAIELNPNYLTAYRSRRYVLEQLEEYEKAKADYEKVIELQPTIENYDLYIRFLNTYIENGSQIALEVCEKIFESFPVCDKLYELRGSTYYYLKNYDNAIADYKKAIELCPKDDTWRMDDLKMTLKQIEQEKNDSV